MTLRAAVVRAARRAPMLAGLWCTPFLAACGRPPGGQQAEKASEQSQRAPAAKGEPAVQLDAAARAQAGIEVTPLAAAAEPEQLRAYASVVDLQPLAELRGSYDSARAQVSKAHSAVEAASREHARVETLYRDDRNMSAKALDEATAALRTAQAERASAQAPLRQLEVTARQDWGPAIAAWLAEASPSLARLLNGQEMLVLITVPSDPSASQSGIASLELAGGERIPARRLSAAGRADAKAQGTSAFYVVTAASRLVPGMTLAAFLPSGPARPGAAIPESAVVLWQGRAWVYVEAAADRFVRRQVATDLPARAGYFSSELPAGARVVSRGAQLLLSQELRAQIRVGEEK
jgi:hypothetical protein